MTSPGNPFEAAASALGYLYQLRVALRRCVELSRGGIEWSVAIEATDDVQVDIGSRTELTQLKKRADNVRLTDLSSDLWKTIRVWCQAVTEKRIDLAETSLYLITTAELPDNTVGSFLQPKASGQRDEKAAEALLIEARQSSKSESLAKAFHAFDVLDQPRRAELISRIEVIGGAPGIEEIRADLLGYASLAVERRFAESFLQRLEGWYFQRACVQMSCPGSDPVTGTEFDELFMDLRNQIGERNLPIDPDITSLTAADPAAAGASDKVFVRQLRLIDVGTERINYAVRDWVRAFTQRSRWVDENLVRLGEIRDYERRLVQEWESRFAEMREELGEEATEQEMKRHAKLIYRWVDLEARMRIRPGCEEVFVTKGSYQMLADEEQVGWHPDFSARLAALLEPTGATDGRA
ncbi:ABC-three component system protein [Nocardia salmonicida]|uniref:ABC-three component system protein n=1 Tax=Nocardia salmonicida TaxID=53431 RepID=UPI0007A4BD45|nr:ABC-three component system protein [Nocardia salmonicida]